MYGSSIKKIVNVLLLLGGILLIFRTINFDLFKNISTEEVILGRRIALVCFVILGIYLVLIGVFSRKKEFDIKLFFLFSIIPLSVIYLILMLPWSVPDSGTHFLTIYRFSNILLGNGKVGAWTGRADDAAFITDVWYNVGRNPNMQGYASIVSNCKIFAENTMIVDLPLHLEEMEFYSIINYLPQVLGLTIGRICGLSTVLSIYIARVFIMLFYIFTTYHAIKLSPMGKGIFAIVPLLPMSLMMSSAFSYDSMVLISSLNFVASILALYQEPKSKKRLAEGMFWAFILGAVKGGGYLILLPIVFILIGKDKRTAIVNNISIICSGLVSVLIFDVFLTAGSKLFQFGVEGNGKMSASFAFHEPLAYLQMCITTYVKYFDDLFFGLGGNRLAWIEDTVPNVIIVGLLLIMGIYSTHEMDEIELENKDKYFFNLVIILTLLLTPMMLLSFTNEGSDVIMGLQGRYYLPILSVVMMVLTKFKLHKYYDIYNRNSFLVHDIKKKCFAGCSFFNCLAVYYMMRLYLER